MPAAIGEKFSQIRESDRVQFNKRVPRGVADGFDMLAIRTRRKVPDLLAEALDLLQERYGAYLDSQNYGSSDFMS